LFSDSSVFQNPVNNIIIAVYVDDLLLFGPVLSAIAELKSQLHQSFDMTDLGPCSLYLGMHITRNRAQRTVKPSQEKYIDEILRKLSMQDCSPVGTPMEKGCRLEKRGPADPISPERIKQYQSAVGALIYLVVETRPDIAFAISVVSQFSANPTPTHEQAVKRIFRYLAGTRTRGLQYGGSGKVPSELHGYSDADWGGDLSSRRSTGGYAFALGGSLISWTSKRQQTVALSSCEAEYMGLTQSAKEAIWLRRLLLELGQDRHLEEATVIFGDNQGAIALSSNPEFHQRTKHIDIQ
jgi:hypothetical protein